MYKKLKKVLFFVLFTVFVSCGVLLSACSSCDSGSNSGNDPGGNTGDNTDKYDGLFAGTSHDYALTADYTVSEKDVKGTAGDDNVTLGYVCSFNLGGHTLDLGGYTLNITSDSAEVVTFKNGKIKNGKLNISVPKGDIEFSGTDIDESVDYELEAASETIRFSNAILSGKCTVKSNTHVNVEYSNVGDITLSGNGTLTAGAGAELGALKVSENASGAKVNISPSASVSNMELHAAASVSVAGSVSSVKVAETVKNDSSNLSIDIAETASVDEVELNAAASVSVAGNVSSVKVAEVVKNDSANLSIDIAETALVAKVELNAAASVSVAGSVQSVTVAETAKNDTAALSINVASTADVARVELNAPASVEVGGGVSNIVVANSAGGSSVTLKETANVATVAVNVGNITIDSNADAKVSKVVVAESVADSVTANNIDVVKATADEIEEYLAHQHIFVVASRVAATCTEAGKIIKKCECGETQEQTVPALGHNYIYSVIKEPTADEKGQGLYRCIRCGHEYTVDIENSVSIVINGLESIFSLVPNGTYEFSVDTNNPLKVSGKQFTEVIKECDLVLTADNGKLSGTLNAVITYSESELSYNDIVVKAVIDGTVIYADFSMKEVENGSAVTSGGSFYFALSSGIKMALANILPFDVEEFQSVLPYLENIKFEEGGLPTDLITKVVDGITVKTTENGKTVYTFDSAKFANSLTAVGGKTLDVVIDDVIGDGAFKSISDLANGVADKKVESLAKQLFDFTEKYGVSQETAFAIAQSLLDAIMPDSDVNVSQLVLGYYSNTVAEAVASIVSGMGQEITAAEAKAMIEQYVEEYLGLAKTVTVEDVVNMLLSKVGGNNKPSAPDSGNSSDNKYPDEGDYDVPEKPELLVVTDEAEAGLNYNTLVQMLGAYSGNLKATVTLDSDNKLVAFEITYLDESGIKVSVKKTEDSLVPVVDVDVMGIKIDVDKTDTGAQASVTVEGMQYNLSIDETSAGANLNFIMTDGTDEYADVKLTVTVKKDASDNITGADFAVNGEITVFGGNEDAPSTGAGDKDTAKSDTETDSDNKITVTGKFTIEKDGGAKIDQSVWNEYNKDKSLFYHMDITISGSSYSSIKLPQTVRLQYVSDDSGEYYLLTKTVYELNNLSVNEVKYTARLLSINGLPEIMIMMDDNCTNWVELSLSHVTVAEKTVTPLTVGTGNTVEEAIANAVRGETQNLGNVATDFYASCYYNLVTGEISKESQHKYVYTGRLAAGSKECSDGIIVTMRCSVCNKSHTWKHTGHYTTETRTQLKTQCGDNSYYSEHDCIVCDYKYVNYSLNNDAHSISSSHKQVITDEAYNKMLQSAGTEGADKLKGSYVKLSDLAAYDFDTTGFYYGYLELRHCAVCGLNVYRYSYYTNTSADGCLRHDATVIEYKGNVDYEGFDYHFEITQEGHYSGSSQSGEFSSVSVAINTAKTIIGGELPFTPDAANYSDSKCMGCGKLMSKHIYLYDRTKGSDMDLYVDYNDNDKVSSWYYYAHIDDLETVIAEAEKYNARLQNAVYGRAEYQMHSDSHNYIVITLYDEEKNELRIELEYDGLRIAKYIHAECKEEISLFTLSDGEWQFVRSYEAERHDEVSDYIYFENCSEDGYVYYSGCAVCGNNSHYGDIIYNHNNIHYFGECEIDQVAEDITDSDLTGLEATFVCECVCYDCNTFINATIVLRDNWVLQNDVYIKTEGLTLDLNGFNIDLNGYHLVLYSYAGQLLTITDNTFDTSLIEDYDPENPEYTSSIYNSGDSGMLIVVSKDNSDEGADTVLIGTIAITCDAFFSDVDDRYTLFDSFKADKGYELEILRAQRPYYPDANQV